jgi:hypothetical protein
MMTKEAIRRINLERLKRWQELLIQEHGTALALVGVGHDHVSGKLMVCSPDNGPSNVELAGMLRFLAEELEGAG